MSSIARPRTNQPRGICQYYTTPRGCFAGSSCKFLHGEPEQLDPQDPLLTPHDAAKGCRYYAAGYCRRGAQCWFKHISDSLDQGNTQSAEDDSQDETCSICFEKPATYGLLSGCSHIFCITCIRQWRDRKDQVEHGNIKKCPMCREPSRFITPSSHFWRLGHPERDRVTKGYKDSMAKVPCRYFQSSREKNKARPLCPFGKDCFYQHLNDDGTPYIFRDGPNVYMSQYYTAMRSARRFTFGNFIDNLYDDPFDLVEGGVGMESSGSTGDRQARRARWDSDPMIRRQLDLLREAMDSLGTAVSASNNSITRALDMVRLRVRVQRDMDDEPVPAAEDSSINNEFDDDPEPDGGRPTALDTSASRRPLDSSLDHDELELDMPYLESVSESSSGAYLSESDSENDEVGRLGRYLRTAAAVRVGDLPDPSEVERDEREEARMMQELAERGPEEIAEPGPTADEPHLPVMDFELASAEDENDHGRVANPPFLTDGRGRVVWSSDGEAAEPASSVSRPSTETVNGANSGDESQGKRNGFTGL